jgi:hypothetical protein
MGAWAPFLALLRPCCGFAVGWVVGGLLGALRGFCGAPEGVRVGLAEGFPLIARGNLLHP